MRNLLTTICLTFAVLIGSAGVSYALPPCPGSYSKYTWDNCQGTCTYPNGNKYVGEYRDGKRHGQGRHEVTDLRVWVSAALTSLAQIYLGERKTLDLPKPQHFTRILDPPESRAC